MIRAKAIVIHPGDNVATALEPVRAGSEIAVKIGGRAQKMRLVSDIPAGHKLALCDLEEGDAVIKYGEPIGRSIRKISRGEHVHVHNVRSPVK